MPPAARVPRRSSVVGVLIAALLCSPALAGTPGSPEITDVAGDANLVNGQGVQTGLETGPDTRPVSVDGADLLAVWFETVYDTIKTIDPETGRVSRVEYRATALLVRIKTQGPIHPIVAT